MTALLFATLALVTIASFAPNARLWGVNHLAFYPVVLRLFVLGVTALAMVPAISERIARRARLLLPGLRARRRVVAAGVAAACFVVSLACRSATLLLGDQNYIATSARNAGAASASAFRAGLHQLHQAFSGTVLLYSVVARLSVRVLHMDAATGIRLLVALIGATLAFAWTRWVLRPPRASEPANALLPLLLATSGATALFFGYIEVYAPFLGALVLYIVTARRALEGGRIWKPIACAVLAAGLHVMGLLLLPSLAWVVCSRFRWRRRGTAPPPWKVVAWTCAAMVPLPWLFRLDPRVTPFIRPLAGGPTAVLSPGHFADVINLLLLASPAIIILAGVLLSARERRPDSRTSSRDELATLVAAPMLLFLVAFRADLGVARDWDLFMPAGLACVWFLGQHVARSARVTVSDRHLVAMTALCAVLACAWIGVNASEARSIARYRAILSFDLPRMKDAGYAYEQLAAYYRERRNTQEEIRMLERAVAASANPRYRVTLGMRYYFVGEKNRGIELLEQSLRSDPSSTRARQTLVQMLFFSGRFDEVLSLCDEGMRREPSDPFYPYHKGAALDRTGRPGEALDALRRARTLNPPPDMMKQIDALLRRLEPKQ